jgi:catechol 2,3-dioxygenase-like lactoylglutathione lyase family enzyme
MQQRVIPALRVASYAKSRDFYGTLGFVESWRHQEGATAPIFAAVVKEGMELFLTEHSGDCVAGGLVHFHVDDVDALHRQCVAAGVAIDQPPMNSLGPDTRDMVIVDPDRNRLVFLTRREG